MTVGQEIIRLELGGAPSGGAKEPSSKNDSSQESSPESKPAPKEEKKPEPKPEQKEAPSKPEPPRQPEQKKPEPKPAAAETSHSSSGTSSGPGNREERRVQLHVCLEALHHKLTVVTGQDEPHAPSYRRASQAVAKHRGLADYF